jgi:hypothetical protein
MKTLMTIIICLCCFTACGNKVEIEYHFNTPPEVLYPMAGFPVYGLATWNEDLEYIRMVTHCDIYLLPFDLYPSDACYQAALRHEQRHCHEGHFHPVGPEYGIEPECR